MFCAVVAAIPLLSLIFGHIPLVYPEQIDSDIEATVGEILDAYGLHGETLADIAAHVGALEQLHTLAQHMDLDPDTPIKMDWPSRIEHEKPEVVRVYAGEALNNVTFNLASRKIVSALVSGCLTLADRPPVTTASEAAALTQEFVDAMGIDLHIDADNFRGQSTISPEPEIPDRWVTLIRPKVDGSESPSVYSFTVDSEDGAVRVFVAREPLYMPTRPSTVIDAARAYSLARRGTIPFWRRPFYPDADMEPWLVIADVGSVMLRSGAYLPPLDDGIRYVWQVPLMKFDEDRLTPVATVDAETGRVYAVSGFGH